MTERYKDKWWFPLYEFVVHITIGTIIFVLIALPAIYFNLWIKSLEGVVDGPIVYALIGVEYFILIIDICLFAIHLLRSFMKAGKALWEQ
ncbi:hypothetical protein [Zooshikella sp. RANM57]|uniref:hypothetical protein n=1 Tax=Zooshikella sp. RANM57 TaxID=3425863 RepID=UPI003D6ED1FC